MNIAQILTLPDGVSGIDCEGIATYVQPAVNKKGNTDGRDWSFWVQFVVIKDATGELGINLNLGEEQYLAVIKGKRISVEKGTVSSYTDKKNQLRKSLKAHLVVSGAPPQGQEAPQQPTGATKAPQTGQLDPYQEQKTTRLSIERQTAWRGACDKWTGVDIDVAAVVKTAQAGAYFIATGYNLADKEKIDDEEQEAADAINQPVDEPQSPREPGDDIPY